MAIMIALDNFHVVVSGTSIGVREGDLYDSLQAIVTASPGHWFALPAGTQAAHDPPPGLKH